MALAGAKRGGRGIMKDHAKGWFGESGSLNKNVWCKLQFLKSSVILEIYFSAILWQ